MVGAHARLVDPNEKLGNMPRGKPHNFDFEIDLSYVDVEDLLDTLGISYTVSHGNATFLCPFHREHRPSFRMSTETSAWICNGCSEKGKNAISFLAKIRGISMSEAKRVLEERYRGSLTAALDDLETEVARNLAGRVARGDASRGRAGAGLHGRTRILAADAR
jgi:CHC2 zinc finger